ncbi:hypothetical protein ACLOJK_014818 [Asimina triloba]
MEQAKKTELVRAQVCEGEGIRSESVTSESKEMGLNRVGLKDVVVGKDGRSRNSSVAVELVVVEMQIQRPATGMAAGGATVAGRRHRDGAHPATGSHNPQAIRSIYINPTKNLAAPPL